MSWLLRPIGLILVIGLLSSTAHASCEPVARLTAREGVVEIRRPGGGPWLAASADPLLCAGDQLRTGPRSRAAVRLLADETLLRLDQNTTLTLREPRSDRSWMSLLKGMLHILSRPPRPLEVETPFVNAGIEGTEFALRVSDDQTLVWVFEGRVRVANALGDLRLDDGQSAVARRGQAPLLRVNVEQRDAVDWALYYPPILDPGGIGAVADAARLLAMGRVDEAGALLADSPDDARTLALRGLIAVVQGDRVQGLALARRAMERGPDDPVPRVALSYAAQADFDLATALEAAREATRLDPDNALAWSRLAELELAQRDLAASEAAAARATALDDGVAGVWTVRGFAALARVDLDAAGAAFRQAMALDPGDPLPRLGLGLARIRQGALMEGREYLETAASLDPNDALFRSYLGRAYYEEYRDQPAATELANAKDLDPLDPTPWFYDAIRKQSDNRPVEALEDQQRSIALNDYRGVYRSGLLLDQDAASRAASLGRIFDDLGFEALALNTGTAALTEDPGNFAAHRLLADSYATLPRHEIARVSELLQAQLLQPLNLTPIQPQLAESRLGIVSGTGPSDLGLNEFNELFIQEGIAIQGNAVVGGDGTLGDDLVVSGLMDTVNLSVGQFHYESDGFRDFNDQDIDIYTAFLQWVPVPEFSLQLEYRHRDAQSSDLFQRLDPLDFTDRQESETSRLTRLGARYSPAPGIDWLATMARESRDTSYRQPLNLEPPGTVSQESRIEGHLGEFQGRFRRADLALVAGLGAVNLDRDSEQLFSVFGLGDFPSRNQATERYRNVYAYLDMDLAPALTLSLGASGDFYDGPILEQRQFSPKFGLQWRPWPGLTLRGAALRTLFRPNLANQQTLEPVSVAGFNQFFNDPAETESWHYAVGADLVLGDRLFMGLSLRRRDLDVPFFAPPAGPDQPPTVTIADWQEHLGYAYTYWAPTDGLALSGEFFFQRFERDERFVNTERFQTLWSRRWKLGARFFDPRGFRAFLGASYVSQDAHIFQGKALDSRFWVVDATLGYRLPRRYGQVELEIKNLLDENFNYEETDPANPLFYPERLFLARITLNL